MRYEFEGKYIQEGNRHFIEIPFNIWHICEQKGNIPVEVAIEQISFECKLIPKGQGMYYIPLAKKYLTQLPAKSSYSTTFSILNQLSRINHNSPYTDPIRKIDAIELVLQPDDGLCGQACIAMLSGRPIEEVIRIMDAKKWQASLSKMVETLDYFGLKHAEKMNYKKESFDQLPNLCLLNVKANHTPNNHSHLMIYFKNNFYDPACGVRTDYDRNRIISYLEIYSA